MRSARQETLLFRPFIDESEEWRFVPVTWSYRRGWPFHLVLSVRGGLGASGHPSRSCLSRWVEPSTSVKRKVTVPLGSSTIRVSAYDRHVGTPSARSANVRAGPR